MYYSSLDSSHQDESNGSSFIVLALIEREPDCIKVLKRFEISNLCINARGMNLPPFDASH